MNARLSLFNFAFFIDEDRHARNPPAPSSPRLAHKSPLPDPPGNLSENLHCAAQRFPSYFGHQFLWTPLYPQPLARTSGASQKRLQIVPFRLYENLAQKSSPPNGKSAPGEMLQNLLLNMLRPPQKPSQKAHYGEHPRDVGKKSVLQIRIKLVQQSYRHPISDDIDPKGKENRPDKNRTRRSSPQQKCYEPSENTKNDQNV